MFLFVFIFATANLFHVGYCDTGILTFVDKGGEQYRGKVEIPIKKDITNGWTVTITFNKPVVVTEVWNANMKSSDGNGLKYELDNKDYNTHLSVGNDLVITFLANRYTYNEDPTASVVFDAKKMNDCPEIDSPQGYLATTANVTVFESWPGGLKAEISVMIPGNLNDWQIYLKFSDAIDGLDIAKANSERIDGHFYILTPKEELFLREGDELKMNFIAQASRSLCVTGLFLWRNDMTATPPQTDPSTQTTENTQSISTTQQPVTSEEITTETVQKPSATPNMMKCMSLKNKYTNAHLASITPTENWPTGFKATLEIKVPEPIKKGWRVILVLSSRVENFQVWRAVTKRTAGKWFLLKNKDWNKELEKGSTLAFGFMATKRSRQPVPEMCAVFYGIPKQLTTTTKPPPPTTTTKPTTTTVTTNAQTSITTDQTTESTSTTATPTTDVITTTNPQTETTIAVTESPTNVSTEPGTVEVTTEKKTEHPMTDSITTAKPTSAGKYDYNELLHKSILFYEAQRSGFLPKDNRIAWRGDSATNDRGQNGEDLVGGWYDAGDHVKFGFPMAFSTTLLTWGLLEYKDAYENSGEMVNMLSCIKWPLDYFLKAHVKPNVLYGQVGDGHLDHGYWGPAEQMTMNRPAFKIDETAPGSDLAAETAAAMAAGSLAFRATSPDYAANLLAHAVNLYTFAEKYQRKYTDSIHNAGTFYKSSSYGDELVWGALWLYKATEESQYLEKAENYYEMFQVYNPGWGFSWDEKTGGVQALLYQLTKKEKYKDAITRTLDAWLPGNGMHYTPKGLAWRIQWGPNRYAANTAYLALFAADQGIKPETYREFARKQIYYMLGDSGRSFVVGFGENSPVKPHHRGSSCKSSSASCDINDPNPNPNVLYGALVGGPANDDSYKDDRNDYIMNEVATDYNAGFQSAVAALKVLDNN